MTLKKRDTFLPYALPYMDENEINEVIDTIKSCWISKGPKTMEFERQFADYIGVKHAIAMNSCTAALHIALVARGIGAGDEVITTPFTFVSSANIIIHAGAKPVFVDIDPATFTLYPQKIEAAITPQTKAIIPVHYAGHACDLDPIRAIAKKHGLFLLEDAAHAVETRYKGALIGNGADATAFSFYATKNLATGEGGMLTTDDDAFAEKARIYSLHGMSRNAWNRYSKGGSWFYEVLYPGYKYNMTDIQAAMGIHQLRKLPIMQGIRNKIASRYNESFGVMPELEIPASLSYTTHAWHLYPLRVNAEKSAVDRNTLIDMLTERNIGTSVHFIPVHLHPYYRDTFGYKRGDFPVAEREFDKVLSLPLYPSMTDDDVAYVIDAVQSIVRGEK